MISLISAWGAAAAILGGVFLWLHLTSDHIMEEVRAHRPNMSMLVAAPKSGPMSRNGAKSAAHSALDVNNPKVAHETTPGGDASQPPKKSAAVLLPHPDPALIEKANVGLLPIIGKGGRTPWRVYSRPFNILEKRPRVAVVLAGMGVSRLATESALKELPPEITFAFAPYAKGVPEWIKTARDAGHEVLLDAPMEARDYPRSDPGPNGLLLRLDKKTNVRRLDWLMSRFTGYIGLTNIHGDGFTNDKKAMQPILLELKRRGLLFLDGNLNQKHTGGTIAADIGMAYAINNRVIDTIANSRAIDFQLSEIDLMIESKGSAIVMGRAYPVTIRRLKRWLARLPEKGFVLAPLSALAVKPK